MKDHTEAVNNEGKNEKKNLKGKAKNEVREWRGGYFGMLLGTLGARLLGSLLSGVTGKGVIRAGENSYSA